VSTCAVNESKHLVRSEDVERVVPARVSHSQGAGGREGHKLGRLQQQAHRKSVIDSSPLWQMRLRRSYARSRSSRRLMS